MSVAFIFLGLVFIGWVLELLQKLSSKKSEKASEAKRISDEEYKLKASAWKAEWAPTIDKTKWIPSGTMDRILRAFPSYPHFDRIVGPNTPNAPREAREEFRLLNLLLARRKRAERKVFFDTVEKSPLTSEQINACICMDDSVLIVAAAGSGKTSTMVAKTGYALTENIVTPEEVLLLAFNRDAAIELGDRVKDRLKNIAGIEQIRANTFHEFGLHIIGTSTGKKPSIAPWLEASGQDLKAILHIVQKLANQDRAFKLDWEKYRLIYARDTGLYDDADEPEYYSNGRRGFRTANNEIVKSKEERRIADWLFYHGVVYEYERPYQHQTATQDHRQYSPDFYYPGIDVYHEHFALDANGKAPPHFSGDYVAGVQWKRKLHAEKGTVLLETSSHGLKTGSALADLQYELAKRGVSLDFDATRVAPGLEPIPEKDLARTIRIFQQHVKNNDLSKEELLKAAAQPRKEVSNDRVQKFLSLYFRIADEWQSMLKEGNYIDFEDMLIEATEHVESGRYKSNFALILADEFQDSSRTRIRLLKALTTNTPKQTYLCVVGDDWQGINRFAGADISVMTEFDKIFPNSTKLMLSKTFRCPQRLCEISSDFIQKNPAQIRKSVKSTNPIANNTILAYGFENVECIAPEVGNQLSKLHTLFTNGKISADRGDKISVLILGRYRRDEPTDLPRWQRLYASSLDIHFYTVHSSKGLEAEYIFLLNITEGLRGFPSQINDDPVLQLAMPRPDPYPMAEERRLFYVALTRASKQVRIFTTLKNPSRFLVELVKSGAISIKAMDGETVEACPKCGKGAMILRESQFGKFYSCSSFPRCAHKRSLSSTELADLN